LQDAIFKYFIKWRHSINRAVFVIYLPNDFGNTRETARSRNGNVTDYLKKIPIILKFVRIIETPLYKLESLPLLKLNKIKYLNFHSISFN
jgi:hypothetical protein